jgi:glycosyltransferase involved in cell wall biosynthesis
MKELALVMPVYNEEACIREVIQSWLEELTRLKINFYILVLNDGSRDNTEEELRHFDGYKGIRIINGHNNGHGPTILFGYHMAIEEAPWVFQVDSDNEIRPDHFEAVWEKRNDYDGLFGNRQKRTQETDRKLVSLLARGLIRFLFGKGVKDPNVPYRLMRSVCLKKIILKIPIGTFAPNIIISGAFALQKLRICNHPMTCWGRATGTTKLASWKIWRSAVLSFLQTFEARYKLRKL